MTNTHALDKMEQQGKHTTFCSYTELQQCSNLLALFPNITRFHAAQDTLSFDTQTTTLTFNLAKAPFFFTPETQKFTFRDTPPRRNTTFQLTGKDVTFTQDNNQLTIHCTDSPLTCTYDPPLTGFTSVGATMILQTLAQHSSNTLTHLTLRDNLVGVIAIDPITSLLLKKAPITSLDLGNNILDDEAIESLVDALFTSQNSTLSHLYLGSNIISSHGAKRLAELLENKHIPLQHLTLNNNKVGSSGIIALASHFHSSSLQSLDATGNNASEAAYMALQKALVQPQQVTTTFTSEASYPLLNNTKPLTNYTPPASPLGRRKALPGYVTTLLPILEELSEKDKKNPSIIQNFLTSFHSSVATSLPKNTALPVQDSIKKMQDTLKQKTPTLAHKNTSTFDENKHLLLEQLKRFLPNTVHQVTYIINKTLSTLGKNNSYAEKIREETAKGSVMSM